MNYLDSVGNCTEDEGFAFDYTRDSSAHAPSDYVYAKRERTAQRRKRDLEIEALWREESGRRKKESAPIPKTHRPGFKLTRFNPSFEEEE